MSSDVPSAVGPFDETIHAPEFIQLALDRATKCVHFHNDLCAMVEAAKQREQDPDGDCGMWGQVVLEAARNLAEGYPDVAGTCKHGHPFDIPDRVNLHLEAAARAVQHVGMADTCWHSLAVKIGMEAVRVCRSVIGQVGPETKQLEARQVVDHSFLFASFPVGGPSPVIHDIQHEVVVARLRHEAHKAWDMWGSPQVANKAETPPAGEPQPPGAPDQASPMSVDAMATAVLIEHPEWGHEQVSKAVVCNLKTLRRERCPIYFATRDRIQQPERRILGTKDREGNIEAHLAE